MDIFLSVFDVLEQYKDRPNAPKSLADMPAFERLCKREGHYILADYLETWRINLEYHIRREFEE